jgi:hypothetical protein
VLVVKTALLGEEHDFVGGCGFLDLIAAPAIAEAGSRPGAAAGGKL